MEKDPFISTALPDEVLILIFSYVAPEELIKSASLVSRDWSDVTHLEFLWEQFKLDGPASFSNYNLNLHQLQSCCTIIHYLRNQAKNKDKKSREVIIPKIFRLKSILPTKEFARASRINGKRVCLASSTDHIYERIENVLLSRQEEKHGVKEMPLFPMATYWSSEARHSGDPGKYDEELVFTTKCPDALVSEIKIKPFTEITPDEPKSYTWKGLKIFVYRLPVGRNGLNDMAHPKHYSGFPCFVPDGSKDLYKKQDKDVIIALLEGHTPVYESETHHINDGKNNDWQIYNLPLGVIGNVIRIVLVGKSIRQYQDSGFYACVERFSAKGFPILSKVEQMNFFAM